MTRDEIEACPECDDSDIYPRNQAPRSKKDGAGRWRCNACGATFQTPNRRKAKNPGGWPPERVLAQFDGDQDA